MTDNNFNIKPHTEMWQKFMRFAGITTVLVAVLVFAVVRHMS